MKTLPLFFFLFAVMGIQTMAQPKIDRNAGQMNSGVKKAIADKAAIDKILNATVTKVEMRIENIPDEVTFEYNLLNVQTMASAVKGTIKTKAAKDGQDVLSGPLEQAVNAVLTAALRK